MQPLTLTVYLEGLSDHLLHGVEDTGVRGKLLASPRSRLQPSLLLRLLKRLLHQRPHPACRGLGLLLGITSSVIATQLIRSENLKHNITALRRLRLLGCPAR